MQISFTKGRQQDFIRLQRPDGSTVQTTFPKKGWFPHDAVHLVVESQLEFTTAFWGRVAAGAEPAELGQLAKAAGHASASRAATPDQAIVELIQAERLVECFEAQMWDDGCDAATFLAVLEAACAQSAVAPPDFSVEAIDLVRDELACLLACWQALAVGEAMVLCWLHQFSSYGQAGQNESAH